MGAADGAGGIAAGGGLHRGDPAQRVLGLDAHVDGRGKGTGGVGEVEGTGHLDIEVESSPGGLDGVVVLYPPVGSRLTQLTSGAIPSVLAMGENGVAVGTQRRVSGPARLGVHPDDLTSLLAHPHDEWVAGIGDHCRAMLGGPLQGSAPVASQEGQFVVTVELVTAEVEQDQYFRVAHRDDVGDDSLVGLQHGDGGVRGFSQGRDDAVMQVGPIGIGDDVSLAVRSPSFHRGGEEMGRRGLAVGAGDTGDATVCQQLGQGAGSQRHRHPTTD